jgi:septum formation protein
MVPIILASSSPRRRELLSLIGLQFEVLPADVDETLWPDEIPWAYAERLARAKAEKSAMAGTVSIGSDTMETCSASRGTRTKRSPCCGGSADAPTRS